MTSIKAAIASSKHSRGLAIIVTNDYTAPQPLLKRDKELRGLPGTEKDGESMKDTFLHLGFTVHWAKNISTGEFTRLIHEVTNFSHYLRFRAYTCIVFAFSGHGAEGDYVYLQDGHKVAIDETIIRPFLPGSSPNMGHLQKLFFFDSCRGELETRTVLVPRGRSSMEISEPSKPRGATVIEQARVPEEGGYLVAFSTLSKYEAYEVPSGGTWMQRLAAKIRESRKSIVDVLTLVNTDLMNVELMTKAQQPEIRSSLNKLVYLHPDGDPEEQEASAASSTSQSGHGLPQRAADQYGPPSPAPEHSIQGVASGGQHYKQLLSLYSSANFTDSPYVDPGSKVTYYRSQVTVGSPPIIGDSGKCFVNTELARDVAAKDALSKLTTGRSGNPRSSEWYQQHMDAYFKERGVKPEFSFETDNTTGRTRCRCVVRYTLNGQQRKIDSGHFYFSKAQAKEKVAKRVCVLEKIKSS